MILNLLLLSFSGLLSGLSQVVNKKLAGKGFGSASYTSAIMLLNALLSIPLLFFRFYVSHSLYYWLLILISTTAFAFSTYFSFKAYKTADVSEVSIIYRLNIVFVALLGIVLLKEQYSFNAYIGLALIFLSSLIITFNKKLKLSAGTVYALLMAITGTIATVLDKIILNDFSPLSYVFVNNLLVGLVFIPNKNTARSTLELVKNHPLPLFITSLFSTLSFAIVLFVLQKSNVSQTMPAYKGLAFITPVIIGIFVLKEKAKLKQKIAGTILGIIGITLLYL